MGGRLAHCCLICVFVNSREREGIQSIQKQIDIDSKQNQLNRRKGKWKAVICLRSERCAGR